MTMRCARLTLLEETMPDQNIRYELALATGKELLEIEASGDRARAENWLKRYDAMPPELRSALDKTSDIPVDIDPVSSFPERPE